MKLAPTHRSGFASCSVLVRTPLSKPRRMASREAVVVPVGREIGTVAATPLGAVKSVYLDFDDTIAEGLSTNVQVKAVVQGIAKGMQSPEEAGQFVQERKALIARLAVEYEEAVKQNLRSLLAQFPPGEFSMDRINKAMTLCAEFDRIWHQVAFKGRDVGVRKEDFLAMAPQTPVKDNALEVIQAMQQEGIEVAVASINWSAEWIQRVMGDLSTVATNGSVSPEGRIKIYSNEMIYEDGVSTGQLASIIESGEEKGQIVQKLLQEAKESNGSTVGKSVFIGDSFNDIQPLLMVDVGIVMGENKGLMLFAQHFGIELKPLSSANLATDHAENPVLYLTDSWTEVAEAILGKEKAAHYLAAPAR